MIQKINKYKCKSRRKKYSILLPWYLPFKARRYNISALAASRALKRQSAISWIAVSVKGCWPPNAVSLSVTTRVNNGIVSVRFSLPSALKSLAKQRRVERVRLSKRLKFWIIVLILHTHQHKHWNTINQFLRSHL